MKKNPFGFFASTLQLVAVFIGLPVQIWTIWATQSAEGLSPWFFGLTGVACVGWGLHAIYEVKSYYLLLPQIPAVLCTVVIIGQIFYYS